MVKEIKGEKDVFTSVELFNEIISKVKESGKWPEKLIDYALADKYENTGLYNYEFEPLFVLRAGCEGYYLDLGIKGNFSLTESVNILSLGTIKTLDETEDGVRRMAALYGECLLSYQKVVSENIDALTRKGVDLYFFDSTGKSVGGYSSIRTKEDAVKKFEGLHEKDPERYARALIRNNLTREETSYGED